MEQSKIEYNNLDQLQSDLSGHEIAYGSTYSIEEIHKAITDGNFAFAQVGDDILNFVGENDKSLIIQKGESLYEITDKTLLKSWSGNAVIVLGETEEPVKSPDSMVIFASDRDTWSHIDHDYLNRAKNTIQQVSDMPEEKLPDHPVIVIFKEPGEKEKKEGIRAMTAGAEIYIYDSSDPVTEFCHELGHVYWRSRLNDDEKKRFTDLQKKIEYSNIPAIFTTKGSHINPEEMFCTIYQWCVKGFILNSGYGKILEKQYPEGNALLEDIFRRVLEDKQDLILKNANFEKAQKEWSDNETQICLWLNQAQNKPSNIKIGNRIIKSKLPLNYTIKSYVFPEVEHEILTTHQERQWVQINEGLLKGKVVVLNKGRLDINYMNNSHAGKIPVKKEFKRSGKIYNRTAWLNPDLFKAFTNAKKEVEKQKRMDEFSKSILQEDIFMNYPAIIKAVKLSKWQRFKHYFGKK